jgi:hypothetical protein
MKYGWAFVIAVGCAVASAQPARAQAALLGPGAAFLGFGASGVATGELDERLTSVGYPTFGGTAVGVNFGAYRNLSSGLMLGAEWHGLIWGEEPHAGGEAGMGGGYGTIGIGYMHEVSQRMRIYPRIGLGGGIGVWLDRDSVVDFDDVVADPAARTPERMPVLSHVGAVVDVGAGVELLLGHGGSGALVGLRLGYLFAPSNSDWYLYDQSVSGGPRASIAGPYIRALVGIGWKR